MSDTATAVLILYSLTVLLMTLLQDVEWERAREEYGALSIICYLLPACPYWNCIAIVQGAAACAQEFHANACASSVPFLKQQCDLWKVCMDSDASRVARTRVIVRLVAELLSELVEGFFGRLSVKTCVSAEFSQHRQN